jgi:hypothetical protein
MALTPTRKLLIDAALAEYRRRLETELPAELSHFTPVSVCASTVERTAVTIGTALRHGQQQTAQEHQTGRLPIPARKPQRLYLGMDGAMAPLRDPWNRDGSAGELVCRFGECKLGVVYEAIPGPQGDSGVQTRAYIAYFRPADAFTK